MNDAQSPLPSVDALLRTPAAAVLAARFGRHATLTALREALASRRQARCFGDAADAIIDEAADALARRFAPSQRLVFNLTGTVLHTNLGRAPIPPEAAAAAAAAFAGATNARVRSRDGPARASATTMSADLLRELTGAEDATVVNNNAAAVLLVLNTLALGS